MKRKLNKPSKKRQRRRVRIRKREPVRKVKLRTRRPRSATYNCSICHHRHKLGKRPCLPAKIKELGIGVVTGMVVDGKDAGPQTINRTPAGAIIHERKGSKKRGFTNGKICPGCGASRLSNARGKLCSACREKQAKPIVRPTLELRHKIPPSFQRESIFKFGNKSSMRIPVSVAMPAALADRLDRLKGSDESRSAFIVRILNAHCDALEFNPKGALLNKLAQRGGAP